MSDDFIATQTRLERAALQLLEDPDVRTAVAASTERWRDGTPGFSAETYAHLPSSIEEVALLVALQVVDDDPHRPELVEISAGPHIWGGLEVPGGRWGINNPDTLYFAVPIEPGSTYVLRGRPTGPAPVDLNISVQLPDVWSTLGSLGRSDLSFETDGSFVVAIGRHASERGSPLPIAAGGAVLLIRQTLADWTSELPYALSIERTDGPTAAPPPTESDRVRRFVERLRAVIEHNLHGLQAPIFALPANVIPQPGPAGDKPGYLVSQRNTLGHFRLAPDEALVLRLTPGGAGYAGIAVPNIWGVTSDSERHRNSLNNHQAVLDPDGSMTVVIANRDPGTVNWVDPGGNEEGIAMLRWQLLGQDRGDHEPGVTLERVLIADLAAVLPPGARKPGAVTADRERLAARPASYRRRFTAR